MTASGLTLGDRLGRTVHVSPLRFKLAALKQRHAVLDTLALEDWLVDIANERGARVVERPRPDDSETPVPSLAELSNEELVTALCQLQCLDRPQILRLAAQLITRGAVDLPLLLLAAKRERAELVLAQLARQALRVDPSHVLWHALAEAFRDIPPPPKPLNPLDPPG